MATQKPPKLKQITHGIILRTSATYNGRYAYFPLPRFFPIEVANSFDDIFADSLTKAPHFPNITILDSVSTNILYETYNTFPKFFHVYNLINNSYFALSFPFLLTHVNAAIIVNDHTQFKVLIVCINEHPNPFFAKEGDNSNKPLVFYLYSSVSKNWSLIPIDYALTSDHLLSNRRKPIHVDNDIVYLDITNRFLVSFGYLEKKVKAIPKMVSTWEMEKDFMKLDEATRYGECRGQLHCAKFNPKRERVEVYKWVELPIGLWKSVATGKDGSWRGKVVGIHPNEKGVLLLRSTDKDEVLIVDIIKNLSWIVIEGRGEKCSPMCFLHGISELLEAAMLEDGAAKLQRSSCGILHPHENVEGPEGEFFAVSLNGPPLFLRQQNES